MAKDFACAMTHVRHESHFLQKWISHYSTIVGRENLYVVVDGDDWQIDVDLTGINVEVVLGAPRQRIRNDRWIAKEMSSRANALRKRYQYVLRGDVDEFFAIHPEAGLGWPEALQEVGEPGYVFALGVDVVQASSETAALNRSQPTLGQRMYGYVSDRYSKPFVISRFNNWTGGAHRLINRDVRISAHFLLFHLALADKTIAAERMQARGGAGQHVSFVDHQTLRINVIDEDTPRLFDFDEAARIGRAQFPVEPDGSPAPRPRAATVEGVTDKGLYVRLPDAFAGLV